MTHSPIDYGAGRPPRFALHRVGRVVFQRWYAAPQVGDAFHLLQWAGSERRAIGSELAIVEVVSPGTGLPSREVVADTIAIVRGYKFIRFFHAIVLEGDSIERRLARGIFTTMSFLINEPLVLAPTVEDAIARAASVVGEDAAKTSAALDALGVLHGSPTPTS